jgi:hypothetical protein
MAGQTGGLNAMRASQLTYGEPGDVADYLMGATEVDIDAMTGALINALRRIDSLEAEVSALRQANSLVVGNPTRPARLP